MVSKPVTSRSISRSALLISLLAGACGTPAAPHVGPEAPSAARVDYVLIGGDVRTMDPQRPHATAVAIGDSRVVAVGTDAEVLAVAGPHTQKIELAGATVTPGLIDAHCHLYGLGVDLEAVSVRALPSEAETVKVVAAAAAKRPTTEWLLGRGWDQTRWPGQAFPTKASLDAAISDRPVVLRRVDGHAIWVNSKALAAAGITKATPDPAGGKLVRDARGEPTGVLIDNAVDLVDGKIPAASADMRRRRILDAQKIALAAGITAVHEMGIDAETVAVYEEMAKQGALGLRVYAYFAGDASNPASLNFLRSRKPGSTGRFDLRGVKFFADGALGSRGARLYAKYLDDDQLGLWVTDPQVLAAGIEVAVAQGWQVAVHAIGDAAVGATLDAFLAALQKHRGDRRPRVEHTQLIAPQDVAKMIKAKAIASMQPTHATSDMRWAEDRIGPDRIGGAYAWRTMLEQGIPLAAGSDFPVEDVAPLLGIYAAVTRQDAGGKPEGGWYSAQKLTLDEAIAAFTRGAAYAEYREATHGTIEVGKPANLTVFDRALAADRSLLETQVELTIVDGAIAYQRQAGR